MSLIFRMFWLLLSSRFKPRLPHIKPVNELNMMVLPNDLDINLHMNNGRYLTICDLSRVDMFPIITEHTMKYKKALKLFQKYTVTMTVTGWDERSFDMVHTFHVGDRVVAEGTSKGVIYSKKDGIISPEQVMETVERYLNQQ